MLNNITSGLSLPKRSRSQHNSHSTKIPQKQRSNSQPPQRLLSPTTNSHSTSQSTEIPVKPDKHHTFIQTPTSAVTPLDDTCELQNKQDEDSFISSLDSDLDLAAVQARAQTKQKQESSPSNKKFTLSLPFINQSTQGSTVSSKVNSLLHESKDDDQREFIKNKLKKTSSISTIEEEILFQDEKGADDVRKRAVKKTFELDSLKHALNNIRALTHQKTEDGYDYERLNSIWDELEGDVLILGGYRGSILRESNTNRRLWIPLKAGLNLRKTDLRIGPTDEDEIKAIQNIYPDGILSHVGPVDVCKRLIKRLKSNPKVRLTDFGYDWRLSLEISSNQLCDKLQKIYDTQTTKKGTYIIAHSMGGLLAHKALQDRTHLIRGIIYVGAPSQCPNILGPLKFGDEVIMNKTILSKETNFFMRSSFVFLPQDGRCFIEKGTSRKFKLDYFDPKVWVKLGLSPLVDEERIIDHKTIPKVAKQQSTEEENRMAKTETDTKLPQPGISAESKDFLGLLNPIPIIRSISGSSDKDTNLPSSPETRSPLKQLNPFSLVTKWSSAATESAGLTESKEVQDDQNDLLFCTSHNQCVEYLQRTLTRTKNFLSSLEYIPGKEYPPLVMVYSNQVPTVRGVYIEGLKDVKLGNYGDFRYGPGDGVVYHKWLLPEQKGFPIAAKINSDCGHVSLMSDLNSMAKAFISLLDNDKTIDNNSNN